MISVYYNGVILKDCVVRRFQQKVVKDESNTDVLYSEFIVTVESTAVQFNYRDLGPQYNLNQFVSVSQEVSLATPSVPQHLNDIQTRLHANRQDFHMIMGGNRTGNVNYDYEQPVLIAAGVLETSNGDDEMVLHPKYPAMGTVKRFDVIDNENGPFTEDISVEQFWGGTAARVSVTFKVCRSLCASVDTEKPAEDQFLRSDTAMDIPPGVILNNRWSMTESKNANWQTERQITGTLRTRHANYFSQLYRRAVLPPLQKGYKRISQRFASDAQNHTMRYSIVDRQEYAAPPAPALDWKCTHTESTTMNGSRQVANFNIKLIGDQNVDKRELIAAAGKVLSLRIQDIQLLGQSDDHHTILHNMNLMDQVDQPMIAMEATVEYTTTDATWLNMRVKNMMGGRAGNLAGPNGLKGYDPTVWPRPLAYDGEKPTSQFACYLQNPCSIWHGMRGENKDYPGTERPEDSETYPPDAYEFDLEEELQEDEPTWVKTSDSNVEAKYDVYHFPYTKYEFVTSWESSRGIMHLPYSVTSQSSTEGQDTATCVKLNDGITKLVYEITAVRAGRYPTIPDIAETITDENNIEWCLLSHTISMRPPEIVADGASKKYGIAIKLIYGGARAVTKDAQLNPGSLPIDATPASDDARAIALSTIMDTQNKLTYGGEAPS